MNVYQERSIHQTPCGFRKIIRCHDYGEIGAGIQEAKRLSLAYPYVAALVTALGHRIAEFTHGKDSMDNFESTVNLILASNPGLDVAMIPESGGGVRRVGIAPGAGRRVPGR
jgi:hypothetical protein